MNKESFEIVRRNHAVEHATVTMLLPRLKKRTRIIGRAAQDGFFLYGDIPREEIELCAKEGLARMKQGERDLAVSPLCGTNIVITALLSGLAALLALGAGNRVFRLPQVLSATLAAVLLARPLGGLVQRHVTTSADVGDVEIVSVERVNGLLPNLYKVRTAVNRPL